MAEAVRRSRQQLGHEFWPDDLDLLNDPRVSTTNILTHGQVTDTYLLALAVTHGGRLATFDRRLSTKAVAGGAQALELIQ